MTTVEHQIHSELEAMKKKAEALSDPETRRLALDAVAAIEKLWSHRK